jgi:hypothetical protein
MIFQDPLTSLNPLFTIGDQFVETIQTHEPKVKRKEALERAAEMLINLGISPDSDWGIPPPDVRRHAPAHHDRHRADLDPDLLIADEPTTALDVIVEAQFLDLFNELREKFNLTIMLDLPQPGGGGPAGRPHHRDVRRAHRGNRRGRGGIRRPQASLHPGAFGLGAQYQAGAARA